MVFLLLAGLSVLWAYLQSRRRSANDPAAIRPALILGGTVFLAGWLVQAGFWRIVASKDPATLPVERILLAQGVLLGGLALFLWVALSRLLLYRPERRDLLLLVPFGLFSILLGSNPKVLPLTAALLALPALLRVRWRREVGSETVALTSLFGALFVLLNFAGFRLRGGPEVEGPVLVGLQRYSDWVRGLAVLHVLAALPRLLWGMNLPIRSVKRRLLVSHLLTGIVPLALVGIFWGLSTYLSVNGERAQIAARHVTEGAHELGQRLESALTAPDPAVSLREWGRIESPLYPGLSLFHRSPQDSALTRVFGEPVPGEEALNTWGGSLISDGIVLLGGRAYLGAVRRDPGLTTGPPRAVLLIPAASVLNQAVERRVDARIFLETRWSSLSGPVTGGSPADTLPGIPMGGSGPGETSAGAAVVPALEWSGQSWEPRMVLLWARVGFFHAVRGLALNLSENPFNLIPLVFLAVVALLFVLVEILTLGMVATMGSSILRALAALRQGTARLRSGNLRYRIPIEGSDDLWTVAESFNEMTADLEKARDLEMEKERMEGELDLARQIQARLLPAEAPTVPRMDLAGVSLPARQIGGDYYDFLPVESGKIGLIIADVSGKGIPAALLMSSFRAALHSQHLEDGPAHTLGHLNTFLYRSVEPGRFVTAFLAVFDPQSGRLTYSNAGHNPPFLLRSNNDITLLQEGGLVLGLFERTPYEEAEVELYANDLLALFTDGVTEATNEDEDFWGEERLAHCLRRHRDESCRRILRCALEEVRAFSGDLGQSDDVTMLLARWRGADGAKPGTTTEPVTGA